MPGLQILATKKGNKVTAMQGYVEDLMDQTMAEVRSSNYGKAIESSGKLMEVGAEAMPLLPWGKGYRT